MKFKFVNRHFITSHAFLPCSVSFYVSIGRSVFLTVVTWRHDQLQLEHICEGGISLPNNAVARYNILTPFNNMCTYVFALCNHVTGVELFQGKLIMYGCGDYIDDYEGITGCESFRGDLSLMYSVEVDPKTGRLSSLVMTPTRIRHLRVDRCQEECDIEWLRSTMSRECRSFGCDVKRVGNKLHLVLNWLCHNFSSVLPISVVSVTAWSPGLKLVPERVYRIDEKFSVFFAVSRTTAASGCIDCCELNDTFV